MESRRRRSKNFRTSVRQQTIFLRELQDMALPSNSTYFQKQRQSQLLTLSADLKNGKFKFKSDQQFRQIVCYHIVLIYLFILEIIQVHRITDNFSMRFKLKKKLIKKCFKSLKHIPDDNIRQIAYSHQKFVSAIYKYEIEDILKNDPNSIYEVLQTNKNDYEKDERVQVKTLNGKSSVYIFNKDKMEAFLKQLYQNQYFSFIQQSLSIHKLSFNHQVFKEKDSKVSKYNFITKILKNTFKSFHSLNERKSYSQNNSHLNNSQLVRKTIKSKYLSMLYSSQSQNHKIMKDGKYIIKFNDMKKEYLNLFLIQRKNPLKDIQKLAQIIEDINVFIKKRYQQFDSFSLTQSFRLNPVLSYCLICSLTIGIVGIFLFRDYYVRLGLIIVCSITSISEPDLDFMSLINDIQKILVKKITKQRLPFVGVIDKLTCHISIELFE